MKIVIASDSFKESIDAIYACDAIKSGFKEAIGDSHEYLCKPMADGGEGTAIILSEATHALLHTVKVKNSYGKIKNVTYGIDKYQCAYLEIASCCSIEERTHDGKKDPKTATSYGLGELLLDAISRGAKKIVVGLGGSGTNDGGYGMLCALGAKFYDKNETLLDTTMDSIFSIEHVDIKEVSKNLQGIEIIVACDVDNKYVGTTGATYTFGPQKGASIEELVCLEKKLQHLNDCFKKDLSIDLSSLTSTGAAGGLSGAFVLLGATLQSGINLVMNITKLEEAIQGADLVISGEGSIDSQTIHGKTISGIARICKDHGVPLVCFAGRVTDDIQELYDIGVTAVFSITNQAKTLEQALLDGQDCLRNTAYNVAKMINSFYK